MIDWIAGIMELVGLAVVGNKNKTGFLISTAGNIVWVVYVFHTGSTYGLLVVVGPAICINVRNWLKWRREEKEGRNIIGTKEG